MIYNWSSWKTFPDARTGTALEAPIGPGVYEVRHSVSGRVIACGSAAKLARTLSELRVSSSEDNGFARLFPKKAPRILDLEYRTCAASSRAEARGAARRLLGLKRMAWHKRLTSIRHRAS